MMRPRKREMDLQGNREGAGGDKKRAVDRELKALEAYMSCGLRERR
jgi:hypothetical protein